ncbi:MAG TPA: [Fe-Fe] hydrogenase large subunit C-terminal domain-containing protein, partial [Gemmatimonadaceae bacterium]
MATLPSILILGPDAFAAARPATPVQLIHGCRAWGFSGVVPSSWGDELIAHEIIRRCAARPGRPTLQCSCPKVAQRIAEHAATLEDCVLWLVPPAVATARYVKALDPSRDVHVTYAGACPANDPSIDERISPFELIAGLAAR